LASKIVKAIFNDEHVYFMVDANLAVNICDATRKIPARIKNHQALL
jgi:hypothetical protein